MKAYELLDSAEKWGQDRMAEAINGESVSPKSSSAYKWCMMGAIVQCYPREDRHNIYERIHKELDMSYFPDWNDAPERTWEEVRALLVKLDI